MLKKIDELKNEITLIFMRTQNLIISSYFDSSFEKIEDLESIEKYRQKLYNFKDYLGFTEGYTFFNDYYVSKMEALEHKYNLLENGEFEKSLKVITKKENIFIHLLKVLKNFIFGNSDKEINFN